MKELIRKILINLGFTVKVNRDKVMKILMIYNSNPEERFPQDTIIDIQVYMNKREMKIVIETHRPGLVIGSQGRTINSITRYIQKFYDHIVVTIDIKESDMWVYSKYNHIKLF